LKKNKNKNNKDFVRSSLGALCGSNMKHDAMKSSGSNVIYSLRSIFESKFQAQNYNTRRQFLKRTAYWNWFLSTRDVHELHN